MTFKRIAIELSAAIAILAALTVILGGLLYHSQANASTLSPTNRACQAFRTWDHHRTTANLNAMLSASKHASYTVKTDIVVVYTEVKQHDTYDLPSDVHFTALDCRGK